MISPIFGPMSPDRLSGGVKTLIMMYKLPKFVAWVIEIGKRVDCKIVIEHALKFGKGLADASPMDAIIVEDGTKINTIKEYYDKFAEYTAKFFESLQDAEKNAPVKEEDDERYYDILRQFGIDI
jgi:hypothetical protein